MNKHTKEYPPLITGHCAACHAFPVLLFKVPNVYRYRCDDCYQKETGARHHMALSKVKT